MADGGGADRGGARSGAVDDVAAGPGAVAADLCVFEVHPPCSMQCLRQIRRGQSSARRVWPQAWTEHFPETLGAVETVGPAKVGWEGMVGDALGDLDALRMKSQCSPFSFTRWHCRITCQNDQSPQENK